MSQYKSHTMNLKRGLLINASILVFVFFVVWGVQNALGDKQKEIPANKKVNVSLVDARKMIEQGRDLEKIPESVWIQLLDKNAFNILWNQSTERAFTGELLNENRDGVFVTAGCRIPVFKSDHKFKSGSGWPSFWEVFNKENIVLKEDRSWGMRRIEVLSKCGEHLGHVFDDGPKPTGLRYCINSAALAFIPAGEKDTLGPFAASPVKKPSIVQNVSDETE